MSLLLAILLYRMSAPFSIVGTNQSLAVSLHTNVLTVAPVYQVTISGAGPAEQKLDASSLQSRLDRQNELFKEQFASDAAPSSGEKKSLLGDFLSPQAHDRMRSTAGSAPDSSPSLPMDFLNKMESRTS
jgi:hypothetical protein